MKEALGKGVSAVVDNTCPSVAGRADFTSLADSAGKFKLVDVTPPPLWGPI